MKLLIVFFLFCLTLVFSSDALAAPINTREKLITVDLSTQTLTAWDDGKVQHQTKVSTGMKLTPTVKGSFKVRFKTPLHDMKGSSPYKSIYPSGRYLVKNVPNSMYFYQGYAIHGAYWHNNFGRPASHGCVNVPLKSAAWLYDFAMVGTRVEVF